MEAQCLVFLTSSHIESRSDKVYEVTVIILKAINNVITTTAWPGNKAMQNLQVKRESISPT